VSIPAGDEELFEAVKEAVGDVIPRFATPLHMV
jgi:hypothetical protein